MINLLSNPRVLILFVAMIVVTGLAAIQSLPRTEDPRLTNRISLVITQFPGASAERVETLVTKKIENRLRTIPQIRHLESVSSLGMSFITVFLRDEVDEIEAKRVWADVRDELDKVESELPSRAAKPQLDNDRGDAFTLIYGLAFKSKEAADFTVLGRYAEELENQLRGVYGTEHIALYGMPEEEVTVEVDLALAASSGLSISEISRRIAGADVKDSAGEISNQSHRYPLEVVGRSDQVERIKQIPLLGEQQGVMSLGDIATVSKSAVSPPNELSIIGGGRGVVVAVRMQPSQRGDVWSDRIAIAIEDYQRDLPGDIELVPMFDQEGYTQKRLGVLVNNVLLGFVLIALVLCFSLGWRSALLVSTALPLTILFALACMNFSGLPIHQMSVTGLIVALGIMVDNAIVMADTVVRNRRGGMPGFQAAVEAVRHLWVPLLGSTVTTILTFMPIVLLPGNAGEFVGGIALTVIFSLIGSYLISHLLVAGLAARFLATQTSDHWLDSGVRFKRLSSAFKSIVEFSVAKPRTVIAIVICFPLLGVVMAGKLPDQFFPASDRDMINFEVYLPESASIEATQELVERIDLELEKYERIESRHWFIGRNAPSFYYNLMARREGARYYAQAMLKMDHFKTANRMVNQLQSEFDTLFPEAQIIVRRLEQGPPFSAPVEIRLYGPELDVLYEFGEQLKRRVLATEYVTHSRTTLSAGEPKMWLKLDDTILLSLGLSLKDVADQTRSAIDGEINSSLLDVTESVPIRVRAAGYKTDRGDLMPDFTLLANTTNHDSVFGTPLSVLGEVQYAPVRNSIPRRDGERINTVEAYLRDGVLPAIVLSDLQEQLLESPLELPSGYRLEIGGESEKRSEALGKLMSSFGLIAVLLVVAVVMSFNSFRLSALIIMVAFQAAGLGMLALALSQFPFGFTSIIGLMGLIGLAINAAIVIIAELRTNPAALLGDNTSIVAGVIACSRHIFSTTITTVVGFLPLLLGGGGFWPPFAIVVAGGTLLTTLVSFLFVPAAFKLMMQRWPMAIEAERVVEVVSK